MRLELKLQKRNLSFTPFVWAATYGNSQTSGFERKRLRADHERDDLRTGRDRYAQDVAGSAAFTREFPTLIAAYR